MQAIEDIEYMEYVTGSDPSGTVGEYEEQQ